MTDEATDLPAAMRDALDRLGLAPTGAPVEAHPLTGGVSSDIWRVTVANDDLCSDLCLKRALPVLRTAARWEAPVERSAAEAAWLAAAGRITPDGVPRLIGYDAESGTLVLEHLPADRYRVWKSLLLAGQVDPAVAQSLGGVLRRLHDGLADRQAQAAFSNPHLIEALRLEPYLRRTASRHPAVATTLERLADEFHAAADTVVHGDVSPKNVLVDRVGGRPHQLDAECATWGDRAFDMAFCLTHLCAKAAHLPDTAGPLRAAAGEFLDGYGAIEASVAERVGRWLPALLLARVDGASPLEYLTDPTRDQIRRQALAMLNGPGTVRTAIDRWFAMHAVDGTSTDPDPRRGATA